MTLWHPTPMRGAYAREEIVAISHRQSAPEDVAEALAGRYGALPMVASLAGLLALPPRRRGSGVSLGLVEPAMRSTVPDLAGATVTRRCFAASHAPVASLREHGTFSAVLLVGQGCGVVRGLVPAASLSVALVAEADGTAKPGPVAAAIAWLLGRGVDVIAIPMGDTEDHPAIADALAEAAARGVAVYAAAGNLHPEPLLFPARHEAVIAVGAVGPLGRLRPECCRVPAPALRAPGSDIPGTADGTGLVRRSGSSVACVVAAGLAALSRSASLAAPAARSAVPAGTPRRRPGHCPPANKKGNHR